MTRFAAQSTVHTRIDIDFEPGTGFRFQDTLYDMRYPIRRQPRNADVDPSQFDADALLDLPLELACPTAEFDRLGLVETRERPRYSSAGACMPIAS